MNTKPISDGTLVRILKGSSSGDPSIDSSAARLDTCYEMAFFASGQEGDDPDGKPYYLLDRPGHTCGGAYWAFVEDVVPYVTG